MDLPSKQTRRIQPGNIALHAVVLGGVGLYAFSVLDTRLLLHAQSQTCLLNWPDFVHAARSWPGGLLEYVAAGLSQTFAWSSLGAAIVAAAIGIVWLLTESLLYRVNTARNGLFLSIVPVAALLVLLNRYTLTFAAILAFVICLLFANIYARLNWRRRIARVLVAAALVCVLYFAGGGSGLVLACLCGVIELALHRSVVTALLLFGVGPVLAYAGMHVYGSSLAEACLRVTAVQADFSPPVVSIALYASVPLMMAVSALLTSRYGLRRQTTSRRANNKSKQEKVKPEWGGYVQAVEVIAAVALAVGWSFDPYRRAVLSIDYHVRNRQWTAAVAAAQPLRAPTFVPDRHLEDRLERVCLTYRFPVEATSPAQLLPSCYVAVHDLNLALAETGQLLDRMFEYPQSMAGSVVRLLPDDMGAFVAHSYNIDVLLELGDVNEAERITCECLANIGPRPWLLERLFFVNVLKERAEAARTCLNLLERQVGQRVRAGLLRRELDRDAAIAGHAFAAQVRSRMYRIDRVGYLENMDRDEQMLRYLLVANPHNRLAYDYLTAHYLLKLRYDKVADNMRHLAEFGYTRMPRHCEEAVLLYAKLSNDASILQRLLVRPDTAERFESFVEELDALGGPTAGNKLQVRDALRARYADTYWFYAMFGDTFFVHEQPSATSQPAEHP